MTRFIIATFLLLGWVFFELSGGTDFTPRSAIGPAPALQDRARAMTSEPAAPAAPAGIAATTRIPPLAPIRAQTEPAGAAPLSADLSQRHPAGIVPQTAPGVPLTLASLQRSGEPFATPLDEGLDGPAAAPAPISAPISAPPPAGIRRIAGSRVNMRAGPGTTYAVLTSLARGDEVEILGDPGGGWLKLRALPAGRTGWIAARLVEPASN